MTAIQTIGNTIQFRGGGAVDATNAIDDEQICNIYMKMIPSLCNKFFCWLTEMVYYNSNKTDRFLSLICYA